MYSTTSHESRSATFGGNPFHARDYLEGRSGTGPERIGVVPPVGEGDEHRRQDGTMRFRERAHWRTFESRFLPSAARNRRRIDGDADLADFARRLRVGGIEADLLGKSSA